MFSLQKNDSVRSVALNGRGFHNRVIHLVTGWHTLELPNWLTTRESRACKRESDSINYADDNFAYCHNETEVKYHTQADFDLILSWQFQVQMFWCHLLTIIGSYYISSFLYLTKFESSIKSLRCFVMLPWLLTYEFIASGPFGVRKPNSCIIWN